MGKGKSNKLEKTRKKVRSDLDALPNTCIFTESNGAAKPLMPSLIN